MKDVAIVGLPFSGKSTVFKAVSRSHGDTSGQKPNLAVVRVPDERLDQLSQALGSAKTVHAQVRLIDVPGMSAQGLSEARGADALVVVCKAFDSDNSASSSLEKFRTELIVGDLATVEKSLDRARKKPQGPHEVEALEVAEKVLSDGRFLSAESWVDEQRPVIEMLTPLTLKPLLHCANEDELGSSADLPAPSVSIRGLLESEAAELDETEAAELMAEFGLAEPATARFVGAVYELLDLISFFTGNESDSRAWEIVRGTKAPRAAGSVHTDFEKGFIRWEAVNFDDFIEIGSWDAAREKGKLRVEGRDYEVRDGDVVRIRHS